MKVGKLLPHNVEINATNNRGLMVRIGCATFAYGEGDKQMMLDDLIKYIINPEKAIGEYYDAKDRPQDSLPKTHVYPAPKYPIDPPANPETMQATHDMAENTRVMNEQAELRQQVQPDADESRAILNNPQTEGEDPR